MFDGFLNLLSDLQFLNDLLDLQFSLLQMNFKSDNNLLWYWFFSLDNGLSDNSQFHNDLLDNLLSIPC